MSSQNYKHPITCKRLDQLPLFDEINPAKEQTEKALTCVFHSYSALRKYEIDRACVHIGSKRLFISDFTLL